MLVSVNLHKYVFFRQDSFYNNLYLFEEDFFKMQFKLKKIIRQIITLKYQ